tara:strand:+ start:2075 stop:2830 length:756 start_codon:yes stop_codon:yes gene_type:complete
MAKGSKTSANTKTQKKKSSSANKSVETSAKAKTKKKTPPSKVKNQSSDKNVIEASKNISKSNTSKSIISSEKIELKPCKGSITRILMDEGMEGYNKFMKNSSEIFKKNQAKWREERMNEFCGLTERESDKIPYDVYEHILHHTFPWKTFEEFLTENENIRIDKMKNYGFIEEKPTEETIYLPLSNEYITKKIHYDENGERIEYDPNIDNSRYCDEEEGYYDCEYSEYEWEEEYNDYESSGDEFEEFDDDFY